MSGWLQEREGGTVTKTQDSVAGKRPPPAACLPGWLGVPESLALGCFHGPLCLHLPNATEAVI